MDLTIASATAAGVPPDLPEPERVGILLGELGKLNKAALKYLILHLNTLQRGFEFEVLPTPAGDPLVVLMQGKIRADRQSLRQQLPAFRERMQGHFTKESKRCELSQTSPPERFVFLSLGRLSEYYYSVSTPGMRVIALGDWESHMAPPSLLEATVTLVLRQALGLVSPSLSKSVHLGTKGCLFDFTDSLDEARFKVLHGFICRDCRQSLRRDGHGALAEQIASASDTGKWLGTPDDPTSPASIVAKLGYDLFMTSGVSPTWWESTRAALRDEGLKELIKLVSAVVLAGLLLWLGLKKS